MTLDQKRHVSILLVERTVVASKATFVKTWRQVVVHIVLSNFSSFFRCLPTCLRKINKLSIGITAMTEAVFSDVGPRKLSSRSCAGGASMLSKTLLSALPEEDDAHVPVSGCDRRNLWHQNSFQFWSSHHDHMHCFARNHHCVILPTAPRRLAARDIDNAIRSD